MFKILLVNLWFLVLTGCGNKEDMDSKQETHFVNALKYFQNRPSKDGADISAFCMIDSVPDVFTPPQVKLVTASRNHYAAKRK